MKITFEKLFNEMAIGRDKAETLNVKKRIPNTDDVKVAIKNSGGKIEKGGVSIPVTRRQNKDQVDEQSSRSCVYYLPAKTKNKYTGSGFYGGSYHVEQEIFVKRPFVVKGSTGGSVPKNALIKLTKDKKIYTSIQSDAMKVIFKTIQNEPASDVILELEKVLKQYGGNVPDASNMYYTAKKVGGNFLIMAVSENIAANNIRNAGYDSILGVSYTKQKEPFLGEIIDLREISYPSQEQSGDIHPSYY